MPVSLQLIVEFRNAPLQHLQLLRINLACCQQRFQPQNGLLNRFTGLARQYAPGSWRGWGLCPFIMRGWLLLTPGQQGIVTNGASVRD